MKSMCRVARYVAGAVLFSGAIAAVATEPEPLLKTCAGLRNGAERLACYDDAVAQLYSGSAAAGTSTAAPAEAMFGMGAQVRSARSAGSTDRQEIASISARIKGLRHAADGSLLIELDNGQVWKQETSQKLLLEVGDPVTISRAAMKSFKISAPDNRFGRVKRVQ